MKGFASASGTRPCAKPAALPDPDNQTLIRSQAMASRSRFRDVESGDLYTVATVHLVYGDSIGHKLPGAG